MEISVAKRVKIIKHLAVLDFKLADALVNDNNINDRRINLQDSLEVLELHIEIEDILDAEIADEDWATLKFESVEGVTVDQFFEALASFPLQTIASEIN